LCRVKLKTARTQSEKDMAKRNSFHVRPTDPDSWEVRVEGGLRASSTHLSQDEAVARASELARQAVNGKVVIHGRDGRIRQESSYGPDRHTSTGATFSKFKTCYISAPPSTNISSLRRALEERSIAYTDQGDLRPGVPLLQEIERAINRSDFLCAVVPKATNHESVLFEMGMARGKKRPILIFVDFGIDLPYFLQGVPYSRAGLEDKAAIEDHLDAFLEHSGADIVHGTRERYRSTYVEQSKRVDTSWAALALMTLEAGDPAVLESVVGRLFQEAGMVTSEYSMRGTGEQRRTLRPDLALWIDELQDFLGNPIPVEVKYGSLSARQIETVEDQLRRYILEIHSQSGLLVYLDKGEKQFPPFSGRWPLIIRLSLRELIEALEQGKLVHTLASIRNQAVHAGT